jgi:dynein heavy chain
MGNADNRLEEITSVSKAAAGLYTWVQSTVNLYEVHKKVEPLKLRLE